MVLKRIGILSAGKIAGLIYACFGLLVGAFFSLFALIGSVAGMSAGEEEAAFGLLFGVGAVIIMPLFYGFIGFVGGLISALIYNLLAKVVGGLELELEPIGGGGGVALGGPVGGGSVAPPPSY